jgi:predicted nucleic acid-binding protein
LRLLEQGLEFADALHVASSAHADRFVTLDSRLVRRSARRAPLTVAIA